MDSESEEQFRQFVEGRSLALRRFAYVISGDMYNAEDLVQGALAKLVKKWRKIDDPERYVRRIIYNDQASRWRRRGVVREDPAGHVPERQSADPAGDVQRRLDVQRALWLLAPRQRAVLVLRFYEDLPEREVAVVMDCSVGTVRSQTSRALGRLRQLAPELNGENSSLPVEKGTRP
ncbi:RNA polymerase sigma-70 factor (sigma-E family) [Haloactinopolyspora alba]|uniref:RNA polymerase sigma-70 factor (Sigma-E family) n=1 Tax=Haloactinopolyspora alba TaxID=648780 RepID=A0A2P8DWK1_9ACTN|nr:SigE family RNA polymerase sigma factor [Haloactinopolyspora alba]PSL01600.1 RNA polymerase sigma-70 factor (sigma-E family) [Haloactinopolyspora alba]